MRADNKISYSIIIVSFLLFCMNMTAENKEKRITTIPQYVMALMPDSANKISIDMEFCIPNGILNKRSRLIILPYLLKGDSAIMELKTIVADAPVYVKKTERKKILDGYTDPYQDIATRIDNHNEDLHLKYDDSFILPAGVEGGKVIAVVTTDGCGECTSIDTLYIAAISNPASLINYKYYTDYLKKPFTIRPKIINGKGEARLQFEINRYDINLSLGNNQAEMDSMLQKLKPIVTDSLSTLESFEIYGMASADGSLKFNTTLSANRANAARKWLATQLHLNRNILKKFKIGSKPEGWEPVLQAMKNDGHPDTTKVMEILEKYSESNDDVQEKYIRRLACWNDIRNKYLQKDRKVEYSYSYTIRNFTSDEELFYMYSKRPDAFSEDEFLKVAEMTESEADKKEVYYTTLKYFPLSDIAACNLSEILIRQGYYAEAIKVLEGQDSGKTEIVNMTAVAYGMNGNTEKAIELLNTIKEHTPNSRYNLGLMYARQRNMAEAYRCLKDYNDTNSAIVAISLNLTDDAVKIMKSCTDKSPKAEYVRAMLAAQTDDKESLIHHLKNACTSDPSLKERAKGEPVFYKYNNYLDEIN